MNSEPKVTINNESWTASQPWTFNRESSCFGIKIVLRQLFSLKKHISTLPIDLLGFIIYILPQEHFVYENHFNRKFSRASLRGSRQSRISDKKLYPAWIRWAGNHKLFYDKGIWIFLHEKKGSGTEEIIPQNHFYKTFSPCTFYRKFYNFREKEN